MAENLSRSYGERKCRNESRVLTALYVPRACAKETAMDQSVLRTSARGLHGREGAAG
jgi:hypothetical protein